MFSSKSGGSFGVFFVFEINGKMNIKLPVKIEQFLQEHSKRLDVQLSKTKALLFLWLTTVTVMWLYVAFCYFSFKGWGVVTIGGTIFSFIHSLAPFVFYRTGSLAITGMFVSFANRCNSPAHSLT